MKKAIVIFCDILGFKGRLKQKGADHLLGEVKNLLAAGWRSSSVSGSTCFKLDCYNFSDSVIAWGREMDGLSEEGQRNIRKAMASFAAALLAKAILDRIPVRMGMAEGEFVVDKENNIHIGQALVDAYETESQQEWVGGAIHPSFGYDWQDSQVHHDLVTYEVPTKEGASVKLSCAINYLYRAVGACDINEGDFQRSLMYMRKQACPTVQCKYDRALDFYERFKGKFSPGIVPASLRR